MVVYAPRELQIRRQVERNGYERAEAERRVDAQLPIDEKRRRADHVIDNSGSLEATREPGAARSTSGSPPRRRRRSARADPLPDDDPLHL